MIVVNEKKDNRRTYYERKIINEGKTIIHEKIFFPYYNVKKNDYTYIVLYDSDYNIIPDTFSFLNNDLDDFSSRKQSVKALQLLFTYEIIANKKLENFKQRDFRNLVHFLRGDSFKNDDADFSLKTKRANNTVNIYLSVYRKYCEHLGITNTSLFAKLSHIYSTHTYEMDSYKINAKVRKTKEVPMYISVSEYKRILDIIRDSFTLRDEIIIRLMFEAGLRIGEVLGLTSDDVIVEKIDTGEFAYLAYLRNRLTDTHDSRAKTLIVPKKTSTYLSVDYNTLGLGYSRVVISKELYDLINSYIEISHTKAISSKPDKYYASVYADRVREPEPYEPDNFFIFLNSTGTRLRYKSWNEILRKIFTAANIPLDNKCKKHNLSHRFRHGFAMFHVSQNCGLLELQELMRHNSTESTKIYFRPTTSDIVRISEGYEKSLAKELNMENYLK